MTEPGDVTRYPVIKYLTSGEKMGAQMLEALQVEMTRILVDEAALREEVETLKGEGNRLEYELNQAASELNRAEGERDRAVVLLKIHIPHAMVCAKNKKRSNECTCVRAKILATLSEPTTEIDKYIEATHDVHEPSTEEPKCSGPHSSAFDCPVHNPLASEAVIYPNTGGGPSHD